MDWMDCAGELALLARVPRQLTLRHEDRASAEAWISGVPWHFSGYVWISRPDYLVEVQSRTAGVDDENFDADGEVHGFLVSIDSDITVVAREVRSNERLTDTTA